MGSLKSESEPKQELNDSGCVQDSTDTYKGQAELLDLSDDVLLYILKLCSPRDLKALGHTCPRLGILICDRTLWQRVDARCSPIGQERLKWLLTHCLTPATQELKLSGYVNRDTRCLGIQELTWPMSGEPGGSRSAPGVDVEHFLLRMWYSHLPRYAVSPRWPDKREAAGKAYSRASDGQKTPLSPLSQLASEIVAGSSTPSTSNISDLSNSGPNSSNAGQNSSTSEQNSSTSGQNSSASGQNSSASGQNSSTSNSKVPESDVEENDGSDSMASKCQGPQFTLNHTLLKTLRNKCLNLSSLALEYCNLDYRNANIRYFPPNLKRLSLKGTRCYNLPLNTSYVGKIQDRLPELEYLDISECEWFEPASLMPLSKVKNLQELYMRDCRLLTECVAYASLATRYGFQKLRILDVRGSPVADSEVSAFGWLPLLEELYVSPPDDVTTCSEHSHKWDDVLAPFNELDTWESDEPDYYKCKSSPIEFMDDDDELKDDEQLSEERLGDVMLGNYITCASLERRIIVIHPNRQNQNENRSNDEQPRPINPQPAQPPSNESQDCAPQPGPSRNLKRPHPCKVLNLAKKKFVEEESNSEDPPMESVESEENASESTNKPSTSETVTVPKGYVRFSRLKNTPSTSESGDKCSSSESINEPSTSEAVPKGYVHFSKLINTPSTSESGNKQSASESGHSASGASTVPKGYVHFSRLINNQSTSESTNKTSESNNSIDIVPILSNSNASSDQNQRMNIELISNPSDSNRRRADPNIIYPDPRENQDRASRSRPRNENARPPLAVHARPIPDRSIDAYIWDCPNMPRRNCIRPNQARRREIQHLGCHLVSDSAVLRFGRADNDNINYIHIGHNFHANDPGMRPARSNLRVLSITGYRNITDRSLEHLVTAAPFMTRINFSFTNVTERGVEVFKAIRPNCEVIFSKFDKEV